MEKIFPTLNIEGTEFIVDCLNEQLIEKADPANRINIKNMLYTGSGYDFHYDINTKNLAAFESFTDLTNNSHIKNISIPNLTVLDAEGMAKRYNQTLEYIKGKTDFELTITPGSPLDLRWNKKILPVLNIAGHPFFVDIAAGTLRPKDDFKSKGISLEQIREYYDRFAQAYIIPYNPKTHEFQEIDHLKITELPKDIIVVKFVHLQELDRVGWNVKYGFGPAHCIREDKYKLHFKAHTLPWEKTNVPNSIKLNLEEKRMQGQNKHSDEIGTDNSLQIKKGRKL
ncbi:hypothetical protein [Flavobacterium anhuiense]|uniref:hypothetical protein n=1 Tax=Flavobacterium anhuiense TaxID=459526 RepID=UPI000E6D0DB1|nr:hypothetical protein [Flavobacterium anhuiense]